MGHGFDSTVEVESEKERKKGFFDSGNRFGTPWRLDRYFVVDGVSIRKIKGRSSLLGGFSR